MYIPSKNLSIHSTSSTNPQHIFNKSVPNVLARLHRLVTTPATPPAMPRSARPAPATSSQLFSIGFRAPPRDIGDTLTSLPLHTTTTTTTTTTSSPPTSSLIFTSLATVGPSSLSLNPHYTSRERTAAPPRLPVMSGRRSPLLSTPWGIKSCGI